MLETPGVDEARVQEGAELRALLVGETGIAAVGGGILNVDLLMRDIQVAAKDDRLRETAEIGAHVILPAHAIVQAFEAVLRVRDIGAHEEQIRIFQGDHAPLVVMFVDADAIAHGQRIMFRIDRSAGVPLLVGIVPIGLIPEELQVDLAGLQLGLLQTEEIGIQVRKHVREPFPRHGPQAVYVP